MGGNEGYLKKVEIKYSCFYSLITEHTQSHLLNLQWISQNVTECCFVEVAG